MKIWYKKDYKWVKAGFCFGGSLFDLNDFDQLQYTHDLLVHRRKYIYAMIGIIVGKDNE